MATKSLPSPETLRQLLRYEPETGKMFWLPRPVEMFSDQKWSAERTHQWWNRKYAGAEAFTACVNGYLAGGLLGKNQFAHRVAWALFHGYWPEGDLDHINGIRADNRMVNLREVTRTQNSYNTPVRKNSTSGIKGVNLRRGKWNARIQADGARLHLGEFGCKTAAQIAYAVAADRLHGPYQRGATR